MRPSRRRTRPGRRVPPRPTYLPGSIIVKFRAGTAASARRAMATSVAGEVAAALSNADFDIVRLNGGDNAEAAAARLSAQPDVDYAQARYRVRPMLCPQRPVVFPAVELSRPRHGARLGHQPRRHRPPSPLRCWIRASPIGAGSCDSAALAWRREDGVVFPALGHARHPVRCGAGSGRRGPVRGAPRLHLGRRAAVRLRRPRHARRGHRRTADQQQRGRRGHGVQRADHAGQGHRRPVGPGVQQPLRRHRRHGGPRRALRRGQRREGHQHEHRPQRPPGAGGGSGHSLCRFARGVRGRGGRQRVPPRAARRSDWPSSRRASTAWSPWEP